MAVAGGEEVSILHPLAALDWEECDSLPVPTCHAQCVILDNLLYVGGGSHSTLPGDDAHLFMSSTHPIKWSACITPTGLYALTTYHSQLVLVGGKETATGLTTNKLWTSDAGKNWKASLPAMPTKRRVASAVNTGTPEYLVVAGGFGGEGGGENKVNTVEVLMEHGWCTVEGLPGKCYWMHSTVHHGKWYLMGGDGQGSEIYYCDVKSLVLCCQQSQRSPFPLWNKLQVPKKYSCPASFGGSLISVGGGSIDTPCADIVAFSPLSQVWVPVGKVPVAQHNAATIVLPTGDLLIIGGSTYGELSDRVLTASLRVSPYDPDMLFSMSSLSRLEEGAGIKIVSSLADIPAQLVSVAGVHLDEHEKRALTGEGAEGGAGLAIIVKAWESGSSQHPPTWRSLLAILKKLGLKDMSEAIEYLMRGDTLQPMIN